MNKYHPYMGGEGVLSGSSPKPLPNIFQNVRITNEIF